MTAVVEETVGTDSGGGVGRIARVIGPVVDIEFPVDAMPEIYNALTCEFELAGETHRITLEVAQHIGDGMVRVGQQRKPEPVLVVELGQLRRLVGADADGHGVAEAEFIGRSARRDALLVDHRQDGA